MNTKTNGWTVLAGIFLFIVCGLELITNEIPIQWESIPSWIRQNSFAILLTTQMFIFPVVLCIGWVKGFPRWSYPYAVYGVVYSLYISNASTPAFKLFGYEMFGREQWGWRAWVPMLAVALIAVVVTRSFRSILKFFTNLQEDWTMLTFGMFGFMPLIISIMFDEVDRLFSLYFMVVLTFILIGTALAYMRSVSHRGRVVSLLVGIVSSLVIASIVPNIYWGEIMKVSIIPALVAGALVFLFMFSPMLLIPGRKRINSV